jgi:hypothetical protein
MVLLRIASHSRRFEHIQRVRTANSACLLLYSVMRVRAYLVYSAKPVNLSSVSQPDVRYYALAIGRCLVAGGLLYRIISYKG